MPLESSVELLVEIGLQGVQPEDPITRLVATGRVFYIINLLKILVGDFELVNKISPDR